MSSNIDQEVHDPVANLHMQPSRGILKSKKSIDDAKQDILRETILPAVNHCLTTGMTRSESKSHKIPHFDEMNIIATYHPVDKDYGHMKIEEPKTPYAPNDIIDEEILPEATNIGIDPNTLAQRLNQSKSSTSDSSQSYATLVPGASMDDDIELAGDKLEHRKHFESHRKQHYNEFEVVRLRKKEIEDELRALEQEEKQQPGATVTVPYGSEDGKGNETNVSSSRSSVDSIKPILVHHQSRDSSASSDRPHHHHHVHVEGSEDEQTLTTEERERKRQFELKRKKHYNEFRAAHLADRNDDEPDTID
ncbi:unnamed protein product [Rotaria socialis]|uniref:Protein phosphatase inhibitor 2 n=1 Tax=Rotaria socialis TaxID=392032 RepID=A0A817P6J4_9BILA|nr:unnamed protein product [Rotaria socialis]CAF4280207.1 unnamed protein product [Rotaria socialis]